MKKLMTVSVVMMFVCVSSVMADWITLDMPGALSTHPNGIYGNKIVGLYDDSASRTMSEDSSTTEQPGHQSIRQVLRRG